MLSRLRWLKRIAVDLPHNLKLAYCLSLDPRVPPRNKAALAAALAFIVSPIDLPAWIPGVGEMDMLALTVIATHLFVQMAPADVVVEQERLIAERRSRFDVDLERGKRLAVLLARRSRRPERRAAQQTWEHPPASTPGWDAEQRAAGGMG